MCITSGPAKLSNTLIYAGTAQRNNKDVHVLAYQNHADSIGPNAMIIPFPTSVPMTEDNILDTREYPDFLEDIADATNQSNRSLGAYDNDCIIGCAGQAAVFEKGSYTIVLADKISQICEALTRVPEHKRPEISTRFLIGYGKMYPNQPIAVCCWDGFIKAEPLLWWYEPTDKETLFIPTMDAHDGGPPDINANVKADHIISVGAASTLDGKVSKYNRVSYSDNLSKEVMELLPRYVHGMKLDRMVKNGDMFIAVNQLDKVRSVIKLVRGASILQNDSEWEMYGWS